ncbi:MAG: trypsin-like peptidase domain-containing protein [Terriglobales bacterium]
MVESRYYRGTIFSIDVDHHEYWITAKHILTGAKHPPYGSIPSKSVPLKILNPSAEGEQWLPVNFHVIDPGNDIDIVVLAASNLILGTSVPSVPAGSAGVIMGGDCEFLGFPYGGGWRANFDNGQSFWMPFVKHCTVSAMATMEPRIWVLDGINNEGFSGGPVIFRTGSEQKIMAVISSYRLEPTEVVSSATAKKLPVKKSSEPKKTAAHAKQTVNLNSGFIIAYDIKYAVEAINKNPIGPLREVK